MCSSCGCCGSCGSSCGSTCGCSCGCSCSGSGVGGVTTLPSDTPVSSGCALRFPVYVSYPAFFASDSAINNANIALFR